jgi:spore germination protein KB
MQNVYGNIKISAAQLGYGVAIFIIASNGVTKELYKYTRNDSWLAVIIAIAAGLVLVSVYGRLINNHADSSLYKLNEEVFGVVGGKLVSVLYIYFFLSLTVFNMLDTGSFVKAFILPSTPLNLINFIFMAVCAYAVKKGADKMTRYGTILYLVYLAFIIFITVLLIPEFNFKNFSPVLTTSLSKQLLSANFLTMIPLGETIAFLTLVQHMHKPQATGKALRRGVLMGASILLVLVARSTAVMGEYTRWTSNPIFTTVRLIEVADILTRLEIINATLQFILGFFKTSILLYATVVGCAKVLNIDSHNKFTLIISALVIVCGTFFFQSSVENVVWFRSAAVYGNFFSILLPVATLVVSEIKKGQAKGQNGHSDAPTEKT